MYPLYHEPVPGFIPKRISKNIRGLTLCVQLFDCAMDLFRLTSLETLQYVQGEDVIVKVLYERDLVSSISQLIDDLASYLDTKS